MKRRLRFSIATVVTLLCALESRAQATRTFISGVGDDVNPCSQTAPCRTFAGTIVKTAAGGEIDVLDSGGFGSVTITKSVSIVNRGAIGGVLVTGTNGIVVQTAATDVVVLQGLSIEGVGTGLIGVESEGAGALYVEDCTINGFGGQGIAFTPPGGGRLFIERTIVRNNTGYGILIKPSGGSAVASIDATHVENNLAGIRAEDNSVVTISNSVAASNTNSGFVAVSNSSPASITIDHSISSGNRVGVNVSGTGALARITAVTATSNTTGLGTTGGTGQIVSFGNNRVSGNATDGAPTLTVPQI